MNGTICYLADLRVVTSFRLLSEWSFEGVVAALLGETRRPCSIAETIEISWSNILSMVGLEGRLSQR